MTHSLRRPLLTAVGITSSLPSLPQRCLLSYTSRLRYPNKSPSQKAEEARLEKKMRDRLRRQGASSLRVRSKMGGHVPQDLGLLDGTFITPTSRSKRPSFFTSPRRYLKLQWTTLRMRIRDRLSLQILRYASPSLDDSWFKRKISVSRKGVAAAATGLHVQMYTAFAEADRAVLRKICLDGLIEQLYIRLEERPRGERVMWELVRYKGRPKLVSDRAARLPVEGAAMRQAVVRIDSVQRLTRTRLVQGKNGTETEVVVGGSGKEKDTTEYIVIQRRTENWTDQEWKVWGTTGENTLEDVEEWQRKLIG